jgi:hypothetical protein
MLCRHGSYIPLELELFPVTTLSTLQMALNCRACGHITAGCNAQRSTSAAFVNVSLVECR